MGGRKKKQNHPLDHNTIRRVARQTKTSLMKSPFLASNELLYPLCPPTNYQTRFACDLRRSQPFRESADTGDSMSSRANRATFDEQQDVRAARRFFV